MFNNVILWKRCKSYIKSDRSHRWNLRCRLWMKWDSAFISPILLFYFQSNVWIMDFWASSLPPPLILQSVYFIEMPLLPHCAYFSFQLFCTALSWELSDCSFTLINCTYWLIDWLARWLTHCHSTQLYKSSRYYC